MPQEKKAEISEIFKWFKGDFEKSLSVPKVIAQYGPQAAKELTKAAQLSRRRTFPTTGG
jgi:hypothetical protein